MAAAIDTPQHYIPLGLHSARPNLSYIYNVLGLNGSEATIRHASYIGGYSSGSTVHHIPYSLVASVLVGLLVVFILYLIASRYSGEAVATPTTMGSFAGYSYTPPYMYEGRKRVLRQLFDYIRGKVLGSTPGAEGLTVTELASLLGSREVEEFADIYNSTVFSPREPSQQEVEEAKRIVSAWEKGHTSS